MHPDDVPPIIDTVRSTPGADPRDAPPPAPIEVVRVGGRRQGRTQELEDWIRTQVDDRMIAGTFRLEDFQQRVIDGVVVTDETYRGRPAQHFPVGGRVAGRTFTSSTTDEMRSWDAEATCVELPPAPIARPAHRAAAVDDLRAARLDRFSRPTFVTFLP